MYTLKDNIHDCIISTFITESFLLSFKVEREYRNLHFIVKLLYKITTRFGVKGF